MEAVQANRAKPEWCNKHEMTGCGECNGLADEIREEIDKDQRVMIAIMGRKRAAHAADGDLPQINYRQPRVGGGGTEASRRWKYT